MNASAPPVVVSSAGGTISLQRLPKAHTEFDERYLQDLLAENPDLLPVERLREDAGPLTLIGREVGVPSGNIDLLFLSAASYPVLVETKLWRNPQARREVLSQTLDYVKDLVRTDFEWFAARWAETHGGGGDLAVHVAALPDADLDEGAYVDRVNRALSRGNVLSLIVGDGIATRLQELVDHLAADSAHLEYSLLLTELAFYRLPSVAGGESGDLLVVPRALQSVEPVERAHVRVDVAEELREAVRVTAVRSAPFRSAGGRAKKLGESEFWEEVGTDLGADDAEVARGFLTDLADRLDLELHYPGQSVVLKMPVPADDRGSVSVLVLHKTGGLNNDGHFRGTLQDRGRRLPEEVADRIARDFWQALHEVEPQFSPDGGFSQTQPGKFVPFPKLKDRLPAASRCVEKAVADAREAFAEMEAGLAVE